MQPYSVPVSATAETLPMTARRRHQDDRNIATRAMSVAIKPKPGPNLAMVWKKCLPCLWRSVVASISIRKMRLDDLGISAVDGELRPAAEETDRGLPPCDRFERRARHRGGPVSDVADHVFVQMPTWTSLLKSHFWRRRRRR